MVKAFAYAASQLIAIRLTDVVAPRSTCHHCAADHVLAHRVPLLPSTASDGREAPATSVDDAVAVCPGETITSPASAVDELAMMKVASKPANPAVKARNRAGDG